MLFEKKNFINFKWNDISLFFFVYFKIEINVIIMKIKFEFCVFIFYKFKIIKKRIDIFDNLR